ncbi:hypothetical protein SNEBB_008694 [Seison nebaliae]|nr:hypothetical protein SNEBB_008694 [Seison nebaliae]
MEHSMLPIGSWSSPGSFPLDLWKVNRKFRRAQQVSLTKAVGNRTGLPKIQYKNDRNGEEKLEKHVKEGLLRLNKMSKLFVSPVYEVGVVCESCKNEDQIFPPVYLKYTEKDLAPLHNYDVAKSENDIQSTARGSAKNRCDWTLQHRRERLKEEMESFLYTGIYIPLERITNHLSKLAKDQSNELLISKFLIKAFAAGLAAVNALGSDLHLKMKVSSRNDCVREKRIINDFTVGFPNVVGSIIKELIREISGSIILQKFPERLEKLNAYMDVMPKKLGEFSYFYERWSTAKTKRRSTERPIRRTSVTSHMVRTSQSVLNQLFTLPLTEYRLVLKIFENLDEENMNIIAEMRTSQYIKGRHPSYNLTKESPVISVFASLLDDAHESILAKLPKSTVRIVEIILNDAIDDSGRNQDLFFPVVLFDNHELGVKSLTKLVADQHDRALDEAKRQPTYTTICNLYEILLNYLTNGVDIVVNQMIYQTYCDGPGEKLRDPSYRIIHVPQYHADLEHLVKDLSNTYNTVNIPPFVIEQNIRFKNLYRRLCNYLTKQVKIDQEPR